MRKKSMTGLLLAGILLLSGCGAEGAAVDSSSGSSPSSAAQSGAMAAGQETASMSAEEIEAWQKERALEAAQEMQALAKDDSYVSAVGASEELKSLIGRWKALTVDRSKPVLAIPITEQAVDNMLQAAQLSGISDISRDYLYTRTCQNISAQINSAFGGVSALAASSLLQYEKSFVFGGEITNQIWILPCDGDTSILVTFTKTGEGIITLNASYAVVPQNQGQEDLLGVILYNTLDASTIEKKEISW